MPAAIAEESTCEKTTSGKHVFRVQFLCNYHLSHLVTGAFNSCPQLPKSSAKSHTAFNLGHIIAHFIPHEKHYLLLIAG